MGRRKGPVAETVVALDDPRIAGALDLVRRAVLTECAAVVFLCAQSDQSAVLALGLIQAQRLEGFRARGAAWLPELAEDATIDQAIGDLMEAYRRA